MSLGARDTHRIKREARRLAALAQARVQRLRAALARATLRGHELQARRLAEELELAELGLVESEARHMALLARLERDS